MQSSAAAQMCLPMPIIPVVDDVGWWSGRNDLTRNGPARTGIGRDHVPADYAAIARLGQRLGIRVQAAMILCEWDTRNILRDLPESTWQGAAWDNSRWMGPWLAEAAAVLQGNREHIEFVLHGLAHSAWPGGKQEASEWFDLQRGRARPPAELRRRLDLCQRIMDQHGFTPFPETFLSPCSHYRFGAGRSGLTVALKQRGVKYVSAAFGCHNWAVEHFARRGSAAYNTPLPEDALFTVDSGLMVVNRVRNFVPWDAIGCRPSEDLERIPLLGLHWPNILHEDPRRNDEIVDGWVEYLRRMDVSPDRMLARDTRAGWTQLAYCEDVHLSRQGAGFRLRFAALDRRRIMHLNDWFTMKLVSASPPSLTATGVRVVSVARHAAASDQWLVTLQRLHGAREAEVTMAGQVR